MIKLYKSIPQRFAIIAIGCVSACGSGGSSGSDNGADEPANIVVNGAAAAQAPQVTLDGFDGITVVPGTLVEGGGTIPSGDVAFSYAYGQNPDVDELIGQALFALDSDAYAGLLPVTGDTFFFGSYAYDHVTGIGPDGDGVFQPGISETTSGTINFTVNHGSQTFSGQGFTDPGTPNLTLNGQVGTDGALTGTVIAEGINATLDGIIFGDPKSLTGAAGAFTGSTETELLIGGFAAEGSEP